MKINRGTGRIKKIVFLCLIALIALPSFVFLLRNSMNSVQTKTTTSLKIENIEYCFDKIYSDELKHELQDYISGFVAECDNFWSLDQQKLYNELCNKYKIVKTFDFRIGDKSNLIVKIEGQNPFCFVNNQEMLGDKDMLLSTQYFQSFACAELPNINIKNLDEFCSNGSLNAEVCEFIHKITDQHWQTFDIDYVNPSEIRLYPKNISFRCILLTSRKTFFDFDKINKALQLYQKVASDKQLQKKLKYINKKLLILDLRFKSSIVARAEGDLKEGGV